MILYVDTSALVKLYVREPGSTALRAHAVKAGALATSVVAYPEIRPDGQLKGPGAHGLEEVADGERIEQAQRIEIPVLAQHALKQPVRRRVPFADQLGLEVLDVEPKPVLPSKE